MVTCPQGSPVASLPPFLHPERQSSLQDRSGTEAPAGVNKAGGGTDFVEISPHSFPWATPLP